MADTGIVKTISGVVKAIAVDGTERILQVGDRVLPNEQIVTGDSGSIVIAFADGTSMDLGRNAMTILNDETLNPETGLQQANQSLADAQRRFSRLWRAMKSSTHPN